MSSQSIAKAERPLVEVLKGFGEIATWTKRDFEVRCPRSEKGYAGGQYWIDPYHLGQIYKISLGVRQRPPAPIIVLRPFFLHVES